MNYFSNSKKVNNNFNETTNTYKEMYDGRTLIEYSPTENKLFLSTSKDQLVVLKNEIRQGKVYIQLPHKDLYVEKQTEIKKLPVKENYFHLEQMIRGKDKITSARFSMKETTKPTLKRCISKIKSHLS